MKMSTPIKIYFIALAVLVVFHLLVQTEVSIGLLAFWLLLPPIVAVDKYIDQRTENPNVQMLAFGGAMALVLTSVYLLLPPRDRTVALPIIVVVVLAYTIVLIIRWLFDWPKLSSLVKEARERLEGKINHFRHHGEDHKAEALKVILLGMTQEDSVEAKKVARKVLFAKSDEDLEEAVEMASELGINTAASHKITEKEVIDYLQRKPKLTKPFGNAVTNYVVAKENWPDFKASISARTSAKPQQPKLSDTQPIKPVVIPPPPPGNGTTLPPRPNNGNGKANSPKARRKKKEVST